MIERRVQPRARAVTLVAGLWEVSGDVVGIGRALEILQVAGYASRGVETVIIVDVAVCALARRHRVQPGQREASAGMIKRCVHPVAGVVALVTGLREIRREVVGSFRSLVVLQVATHTSRRV